MHESQSAIRTIIERVRSLLDEPDINAKNSDSFILNHYVGPAIAHVMARCNLTSSTRVFLNYDFEITEDRNYVLPPCISTIIALYLLEEEGGLATDIVTPRSRWHAAGPVFQVDGNPGSLTLGLTDDSISDTWARLVYVPSGDTPLHLGSGTLAHSTAYSEVTLASTPTIGMVDRRPNAYAGSYLRIIPTSGPIEERLITRSYWTGSAWKVRTVLPCTTTAGSVTYEIAPAGHAPLWNAIAAFVALEMSVNRDLSTSKRAGIQTSYTQALKTMRDTSNNMLEQLPHKIEMATPQALAASPFTFFNYSFMGLG